jgi:hypothetical protein
MSLLADGINDGSDSVPAVEGGQPERALARAAARRDEEREARAREAEARARNAPRDDAAVDTAIFARIESTEIDQCSRRH